MWISVPEFLLYPTHSLTHSTPFPKMPGVRCGFKVKWLDFIVEEENKTMRAYSKASWRRQIDNEVEEKLFSN